MSPAGDQRPDDRVLKSAVDKGLISKEMADDAQRESLITQTRATDLLIRKGVLTKHIVDNLAGLQPPAHPEPVAIAGFKIIGQLGKGGMGTVYKALQVSMNREVALKVIARQFAEDPGFCERFLREARAAGAVNHPNVITCYDVGQDQEWLYMALELMTGGDAASLPHDRGGRVNEVRALRVIADCARGLSALKRSGLIHRDIKPANIFISQDGIAKLGDLGLARSTSGDDRMTMTGAAMGTPAFMSPEQASGESDLDIRTDIYALGASLFAMLTGDIPFRGASAFAVVAKVINDPTPDPRVFNPALSDGAASIVLAAMAKVRDQRYATPEQMIEDVERVLTDRALLTAALVPRPAAAMQQATIVGYGLNTTVPESHAGHGASTVATVPVRSPSNAEAKTIITPMAGMAPSTAVGPSTTHLAEAVGAASAARHSRSRLVYVVVAVLAVLLFAGAAVAMSGRGAHLIPSPGPSAASQPSAAVAAAPAPAAVVASAPPAVAPPPTPPHVSGGVQDAPLSLDEPGRTQNANPGEQLQPPPETPVYHPTPAAPVVAAAPVAQPMPEPVAVAAPQPVAQPVAVVRPAPAVDPPAPVAMVAMSRQQLDNYRQTLRDRSSDALVNDAGNNTVAVTIDPAARDLAALDGLPVSHLDCTGCTHLNDLRVLRELPLVSLSLNGCSGVTSLAAIAGKPLVALDLSGCDGLSGDLGALSGMPLRDLRIAGCHHLTSIAGIESAQLTTFDATDCRKLASITVLSGMPLVRVELVHCPRIIDIEALRGSPLEVLDLSGCDSLTTLLPLGGTHLRLLGLEDCRKLVDLQGLDGVPLHELSITHCPQLASLVGLHTSTLTHLVIVRCPELLSLNGLQGNHLKTLELTSCPELGGELKVLKGMPIEEVTIRDCGSLVSLEGLDHAPLRRAVVVSCRHLTDMRAVQRPGIELITDRN